MQFWGWAIRCETAEIADDTKALLFALDSLCGLMPRALAARLFRPFASLIGDGTPSFGDPLIMNVYHATMRRPRTVGIACAIGAVTLGLAYLAIADAPARYLEINIGALVAGLTILTLFGRTASVGQRGTGGAIAAMAGVLLATALLGNTIGGAARWVDLGAFSIQPSLILLPAMLAAFARNRNALATAGIIAAAAAMAIQPDRAMAGMLAAGLAAIAIMRPDRHIAMSFGASIIAFATTLVRTDTLPAAPYVDQILYTAFDVHALAGAAVLSGSVLLLVPAIVGWRRDPVNRATYAAFGAVWCAGIIAAALGNYPTPIVGYGGSAIIGYALSLLALPTLVATYTAAEVRSCVEEDTAPLDRHLLVALA